MNIVSVSLGERVWKLIDFSVKVHMLCGIKLGIRICIRKGARYSFPREIFLQSNVAPTSLRGKYTFFSFTVLKRRPTPRVFPRGNEYHTSLSQWRFLFLIDFHNFHAAQENLLIYKSALWETFPVFNVLELFWTDKHNIKSYFDWRVDSKLYWDMKWDETNWNSYRKWMKISAN